MLFPKHRKQKQCFKNKPETFKKSEQSKGSSSLNRSVILEGSLPAPKKQAIGMNRDPTQRSQGQISCWRTRKGLQGPYQRPAQYKK